jgi:hypothetical protein
MLVSFARSSQARAFAQQYSGFNTRAFFSSLDFHRQIPVRRDAELPGSGLSKMAAPNKETEEDGGDKKTRR